MQVGELHSLSYLFLALQSLSAVCESMYRLNIALMVLLISTILSSSTSVSSAVNAKSELSLGSLLSTDDAHAGCTAVKSLSSAVDSASMDSQDQPSLSKAHTGNSIFAKSTSQLYVHLSPPSSRVKTLSNALYDSSAFCFPWS